ncbi:MAG TPA: putative nucleotidyltransferase substrate binding domain-containing protein [Arenibaculum sp.]|nr:putative nucleotidyltransferase substrate binding domain-containing protein [Arenibaculum sp.]
MDVDLSQVRDFLAAHHPYDLLPADELAALASMVRMRRLPTGGVLMEPGERIDVLSVVRSGALETRSAEGQLLARLGEGEAAGVRALLRDGVAVNRITAIEDTALYQVPGTEFHRLRETHPPFCYFFAPQGAERLRGARTAAGAGDQFGLITRRVGDLLRREPVVIDRTASIREAAEAMSRAGVSCLLVVEDGRLCGILTDRDLRGRVLATGRSSDDPVEAVMTAPVRGVPVSARLFEALLLMARHNIHHLPVLREGVPAGLVTSTDLLRTQTRSLVFIAEEVHQRANAEEIAETLRNVPNMVFDLVEGGVNAHAIGHAVSSLADAATERLVQLAEAEFGPPPVPYAWLAAGSQGRSEQTARSDQDNCLLLSDDYDPDRHGSYFATLASFVCNGLNTAGYVYCPGEIMAMTPRWRQPLRHWVRLFSRWIDEPDPKALMYASVFFDIRAVCGDAGLFRHLQAEVLDRARGKRLFLGHLTGNALTRQPPLGLFRNFVLISGGEHHRTLDLKHSGIVPIVDLARIYALDAGLSQVNTADRLEAAGSAGRISREGARDLTDALEFLGLVRLRHQARQIGDGREADNYLAPVELSSFERSHLKDAFSVVKVMQSAAAASYRGGRG